MPQSSPIMQLFSLNIELHFQPSNIYRKYQRTSFKKRETCWFVKEGNAIKLLYTCLIFKFKTLF